MFESCSRRLISFLLLYCGEIGAENFFFFVETKWGCGLEIRVLIGWVGCWNFGRNHLTLSGGSFIFCLNAQFILKKWVGCLADALWWIKNDVMILKHIKKNDEKGMYERKYKINRWT